MSVKGWVVAQLAAAAAGIWIGIWIFESVTR
jgi:hypothetical protein